MLGKRNRRWDPYQRSLFQDDDLGYGLWIWVPPRVIIEAQRGLREGPGSPPPVRSGHRRHEYAGVSRIPKIIRRVEDFFQTCCVEDPTAEVASAALFEAFKVFEQSLGILYSPISRHIFGRIFGRWYPRRKSGKKFYVGVRLKEKTDEDLEVFDCHQCR